MKKDYSNSHRLAVMNSFQPTVFFSGFLYTLDSRRIFVRVWVPDLQ